MEQLPTVLTIRRAAMAELPERFAGDDVRFAPEFARLMIERFTNQANACWIHLPVTARR